MTVAEIKAATDNGQKVHWSNGAYEVVKDCNGKYLIKCTLNGHCIGLTWANGTTLNGAENDFFIAK